MSVGLPCCSGTVFGLSRGRIASNNFFSIGMASWPTDPIGTFVLTLTNVVVGSRIHVEKQSDGTSYYDDVAVTSTVSISLSAYGVGSAYNDLVIKVRKASSNPSYQPWETQATAIVGSQSIYVSQIPDE